MPPLGRRAALAGALAAGAMPARAAGRPFVAVAGDSLAVGLADALLAMNPGAPVVGYGVGSSGLRGTVPVDWQARIRDVVSARPALALVLIGMNDVASAPGPDYLRNIEGFLGPLSDASVPFGVVSVPPTDDPAMNVRIEALNRVFSILAPAMRGGHYVGVQPLHREMRQRDGIHLTAAGYRELARRVVAGMLPA